MMNFIFELNHPKHYYQFKHVIESLKKQNHLILILARNKDVLLNVLAEEKVDYVVFGKHYKSILGKVFGSILILLAYYRIVRKFKPNAIVSKASVFAVIIGKIINIKTFIFPDSEVVKLTNKIVAPLASYIITPNSFELDFGEKHFRVPGLFESCYLAPNVFTPNFGLISSYVKKPYAIIRFVGWNANHDINNSGFSLSQKLSIVNVLKPYMNVYVSSETTLPDPLSEYNLTVPTSLIHHVLSFSDLYIGDSQTMATEAALLGTPSFRSNSFVGENDMSNFKILENEFGLLLNISDFDTLVSQVEEFAKVSRKNEWKKKIDGYNEKVGDLNEIIKKYLFEFTE